MLDTAKTASLWLTCEPLSAGTNSTTGGAPLATFELPLANLLLVAGPWNMRGAAKDEHTIVGRHADELVICACCCVRTGEPVARSDEHVERIEQLG